MKLCQFQGKKQKLSKIDFLISRYYVPHRFLWPFKVSSSWPNFAKVSSPPTIPDFEVSSGHVENFALRASDLDFGRSAHKNNLKTRPAASRRAELSLRSDVPLTRGGGVKQLVLH